MLEDHQVMVILSTQSRGLGEEDCLAFCKGCIKPPYNNRWLSKKSLIHFTDIQMDGLLRFTISYIVYLIKIDCGF